MTALADTLSRLKCVAEPNRIPDCLRYFKTGPGEYGEGDKFLGVRMGPIRNVVKDLFDGDLIQLKHIPELFASEYHEVRMVAALWLVQAYKRAGNRSSKRKNKPREVLVNKESIFRMYVESIPRLNGWDLVDVSAPHVTGKYLLEEQTLPQAKAQILRWCSNENLLWKKRVGMLSTSVFIRADIYSPTIDAAELILKSKETHDLMHKATGWMLREVGIRHRETLELFLNKHAATMPRTMLRYALEKFDKTTKKFYMDAAKNPRKFKLSIAKRKRTQGAGARKKRRVL